MIESEFDVQILEASDGEVALNHLKENPDIAVLICDYDMPKKTGADVYEYSLKNLNKPFILLSGADNKQDEKLSGFSERKENYVISKPFEHGKFTSILAQAIKQSYQMSNNAHSIEEDSLLQSSSTGYFRIRGTKLLNQANFVADTYIKISDGKFIKIGDKSGPIATEQIQRYLDKNIEYFFLNKEQFNDFMNNSIKDLMSKFDNTALEAPEVMSLHLASIKQVQEVVKNIGVKEEVIELTDKVANMVNSALVKEKNLNMFLVNIVNKEDYFFAHSNIINYLCSAMVKELGWDKDRATKRFITVSMFFDIALNDPKLASIHDINAPLFNSLSKQERTEILSHLKNAIDIVSKSQSIMSDEFKIIEQHHEKPDGKGFPKGLNAKQIPPQSAVFIIAHDFAHLLIKHGGPDKITNEEILEKMGPTYTQGNFENPLSALKKALKTN
jgi:response regulator RpfG family c-di-GMP phosphodiesterase